MTVMTASAPNVPVNTAGLDCLSASSSAMKNVLSPISEKKIRRKPDTNPSLKGESPTIPDQAVVDLFRNILTIFGQSTTHLGL